MTAFDPQEWLARFEAAGGGWIVQEGVPVLLCPPGARDCANCLAQLSNGVQRVWVLAIVLDRYTTKEMRQPANLV